jgi:very-short-patch-repair endonuclease
MNSTTTINRARHLRKAQTLFEQQLWKCLRDRRFKQFKFRRQHPMGSYIVDFVCLERMLIVELDGSQHAKRKSYDAERDAWLTKQDFRVLRIWNNQWIAERESVLQAILNALLSVEPLTPGPSPSRGEGSQVTRN